MTVQSDEIVQGDDVGGPLAGVRVLDLSGAIGAYCSKLLADLGADVLIGEPPAGDELRRRPPFIDGVVSPEASAVFASYHANKRAVTIDVTRSESRPILDALGTERDVVVVSPTARRPIVGFDRDLPRLEWASSQAIVAAITPFGLTGPLRDMRMTPFLSFAMGGGMHWLGPKEGPPLAAPGQIQWDEAAIHAALGVLSALVARSDVGGQLLDLSVHEVAAAKDFLLERYDAGDLGAWGRSVGVGIPPTGTWMCADGPFDIASHQKHHWEAFLTMLDHPDELSEPSLGDALVRREIFDGLQEVIAALLADRSRMELFDKGQAAGLPCAPYNTPGEFVSDIQPQAREIFASSDRPTIGEVTIPWRWCHSTSPMLRLDRPAPLLGQHNTEVYVEELGFGTDELAKWNEMGLV